MMRAFDPMMSLAPATSEMPWCLSRRVFLQSATLVPLMSIPEAIPAMAEEQMVGAPAYVTQLEAQYGAPSQNGLGSAVFFRADTPDPAALEAMVRDRYQYFLGPLWEKQGEEAWMGPWRNAYTRSGERDIVTELAGLSEPDVTSSADMILNGLDDPAAAQAALKVAFDDPAVADLVVYRTGDGEAYSGLIIAARRQNGEALCLVFLMD